MDRNGNSRLKLEIARCKEKLSDLKPKLEDQPELNEEYNQILVKKAIMFQGLKRKETMFERFTRQFKRKKESLICDYFKTSLYKKVY